MSKHVLLFRSIRPSPGFLKILQSNIFLHISNSPSSGGYKQKRPFYLWLRQQCIAAPDSDEAHWQEAVILN